MNRKTNGHLAVLVRLLSNYGLCQITFWAWHVMIDDEDGCRVVDDGPELLCSVGSSLGWVAR